MSNIKRSCIFFLINIIILLFTSKYLNSTNVCNYKFGFIVKPPNENNLFFVELEDTLLNKGVINVETISEKHIKCVYNINEYQNYNMFYTNSQKVKNLITGSCDDFAFVLLNFENLKYSSFQNNDREEKDTIRDEKDKSMTIRYYYTLKYKNNALRIKDKYNYCQVKDCIFIYSSIFEDYLCR